MKTKSRTRKTMASKTVRVIDRHGIERVWAICSVKCVGCCYHGLHNGVVHVCANKEICEMKDND